MICGTSTFTFANDRPVLDEWAALVYVTFKCGKMSFSRSSSRDLHWHSVFPLLLPSLFALADVLISRRHAGTRRSMSSFSCVFFPFDKIRNRKWQWRGSIAQRAFFLLLLRFPTQRGKCSFTRHHAHHLVTSGDVIFSSSSSSSSSSVILRKPCSQV